MWCTRPARPHTYAIQYLVDVVLDARNPHEMDEVRQKIRETMKSTSTVLVVTVEVHSNDHRMYVAKGKKTLDMRTVSLFSLESVRHLTTLQLLDMFLGTELMNDFFEYPGKKMLWIATCSAPDMAEARLYEWGNLITMCVGASC
jgi:ribosomal protein L31